MLYYLVCAPIRSDPNRSRTICLANGVVSSTSEIDINNVNNNQANEPQRKCRRRYQVEMFRNGAEVGGIYITIYPLVNVYQGVRASQMV